MFRKLQIGLPTVALFLSAVALILLSQPSQAPTDFYRFWLVGELHEKTEIKNIFSPDITPKIQQFIASVPEAATRIELEKVTTRKSFSATPWLYLVFDIFSTDSLLIDTRNFRLISAALAAFGLVVLLRLLAYPFFLSMGAIIFFGLFFWPVRFDIRWGNTGLIQLGLMSILLLILRANRFFVAGLMTSVLVLFKPTVIFVPLALLSYWIAQKEIKKFLTFCVGLGLGALFVILISTIYWGDFCSWTDWHTAAYSNVLYGELLNSGLFVAKNNFIFHSSPLFYGTALLVCGLAFFMPSRNQPLYLNLALALALFLLSGPIIQMHYFVLAIPLIIWIFRPKSRETLFRTSVATLGVLLIGLDQKILHELIPPYSLRTEWQSSIGMAILVGLAIIIDMRPPSTHAALIALSQTLRKAQRKIKTEPGNEKP